MYVYLDNMRTGGVYTVGFYDPSGKWQPESDHSTSEEAAKRVAYLNGSSACNNCGLAYSVNEAANRGRGYYHP